MDEQVKQKLNTMSLELIDSIQKGVELTGQQTLLFIKEYVAVHILTYSIYFVSWLIVSAALVYIGKKMIKESANDDKYCRTDKSALNVFGHVFLGISVVCFVINFACNALEIGKGIWAPRVVIVQALHNLAK